MAVATRDAGTTAKDSDSSSDSGPGKPVEAVPALVAELAKAPAAPKADDNIARAIATGWHAREALTAARQADGNAAEPEIELEKPHLKIAVEHLGREMHDVFLKHATQDGKTHDIAHAPQATLFVDASHAAEDGFFMYGVHDITGQGRLALVCAQLTTDVASLAKLLKAAGQDRDQVTRAIASLASAANHTREAKATELASRLMQTLTAADFRLGKAFALGWDLAALRRVAENDPDYESAFARHFLARQPDITARLTDLASLLPANAGHAVRASIGFWDEALATKKSPDPGDVKGLAPGPARVPRPDLPIFTKEDVAEQVGRWRTLLTGEKAAKDELERSDYVDAAGGLAGQLAATIGAALRQAPGAIGALIIAVVALAVGGGLVLAFSPHTAAGITALVGAMGLTWKGLGTTVGKGVAKVEQPAWDAQLDDVIARRITTKQIREKVKRDVRNGRR